MMRSGRRGVDGGVRFRKERPHEFFFLNYFGDTSSSRGPGHQIMADATVRRALDIAHLGSVSLRIRKRLDCHSVAGDE